MRTNKKRDEKIFNMLNRAKAELGRNYGSDDSLGVLYNIIEELVSRTNKLKMLYKLEKEKKILKRHKTNVLVLKMFTNVYEEMVVELNQCSNE